MKPDDLYDKVTSERKRIAASIDGWVASERLRSLIESSASLLEFQQTCLALGIVASTAGDTKGAEAGMEMCDASIKFTITAAPVLDQLKKEGLL